MSEVCRVWEYVEVAWYVVCYLLLKGAFDVHGVNRTEHCCSANPFKYNLYDGVDVNIFEVMFIKFKHSYRHMKVPYVIKALAVEASLNASASGTGILPLPNLQHAHDMAAKQVRSFFSLLSFVSFLFPAIHKACPIYANKIGGRSCVSASQLDCFF